MQLILDDHTGRPVLGERIKHYGKTLLCRARADEATFMRLG
jgi:hypothetical protein